MLKTPDVRGVVAGRSRNVCPPHGPHLVETLKVGRHAARCLRCGLVGPEHEDRLEASENREIGGTKITHILFVEYPTVLRQSASFLMDQQPDLEVVSQAGSVAEGREKMAEGGIDAAIVDVPLPDEGAAEMVGELHESNPSIPVLVLTCAGDPEASEVFLKARASEVLSKECTFAQILAAVRRLGDEA